MLAGLKGSSCMSPKRVNSCNQKTIQLVL